MYAIHVQLSPTYTMYKQTYLIDHLGRVCRNGVALGYFRLWHRAPRSPGVAVRARHNPPPSDTAVNTQEGKPNCDRHRENGQSVDSKAGVAWGVVGTWWAGVAWGIVGTWWVGRVGLGTWTGDIGR